VNDPELVLVILWEASMSLRDAMPSPIIVVALTVAVACSGAPVAAVAPVENPDQRVEAPPTPAAAEPASKVDEPVSDAGTGAVQEKTPQDAFEALLALPQCGKHTSLPIQQRRCDVPFVLNVAEEMRRPHSRFEVVVGFEYGWLENGSRCFGDVDTSWAPLETRGTAFSWRASMTDYDDCPRENPEAVCYYFVGYVQDGTPYCLQRQGSSPYVVQFHDNAPYRKELAGEKLECWDPCCALGEMLPRKYPVRVTVRCPACKSKYLRVWSDCFGTEGGEWSFADAVDALVGKPFDMEFPAGRCDLHAAELLGPHRGELKGVEIRQGMGAIEIVVP
jgi:hypothetical protein